MLSGLMELIPFESNEVLLAQVVIQILLFWILGTNGWILTLIYNSERPQVVKIIFLTELKFCFVFVSL